MIDFGLAGLFERFEKEFGRTITRAILALIGVTIVVVSLGLIAQFLWALYVWTTTTLEGTSMLWLVPKFLGFVGGFAAIVSALMIFSWSFESKAMIRRAQSHLQEARESAERSELLFQELSALRTELLKFQKAEEDGSFAPTAEAPDTQSPPSTEEKTQP